MSESATVTETKGTDDERIIAIIGAHEAGVEDAIKALELAEKPYFEALSAASAQPVLVPATTTTPGPTLAGANTGTS